MVAFLWELTKETIYLPWVVSRVVYLRSLSGRPFAKTTAASTCPSTFAFLFAVRVSGSRAFLGYVSRVIMKKKNKNRE